MQNKQSDNLTSEQTAILIANTAINKKALDPVIIDIRNLSSYADYLVICSGMNDRHVSSIATGIDQEMAPLRECIGNEGIANGQWVLLDYGDIIAHVFYAPIRPQFDLEELWKDAPRVHFEIPPHCLSNTEMYYDSLENTAYDHYDYSMH